MSLPRPSKHLKQKGLTVNGDIQHRQWTPLHGACNSYPPRTVPIGVDILTLLIRAGADMNATTFVGRYCRANETFALTRVEHLQEGMTPLHLAAGSQPSEIIALLLDNGADPTLEDSVSISSSTCRVHHLPGLHLWICSYMAKVLLYMRAGLLAGHED
jgi:ankyrin repeat protein